MKGLDNDDLDCPPDDDDDEEPPAGGNGFPDCGCEELLDLDDLPFPEVDLSFCDCYGLLPSGGGDTFI